MRDEKQRFSLRKLSVGLASVLIGITFFETGHTVKADSVSGNQEQAQSAIVENKNNVQNQATTTAKVDVTRNSARTVMTNAEQTAQTNTQVQANAQANEQTEQAPVQKNSVPAPTQKESQVNTLTKLKQNKTEDSVNDITKSSVKNNVQQAVSNSAKQTNQNASVVNNQADLNKTNTSIKAKANTSSFALNKLKNAIVDPKQFSVLLAEEPIKQAKSGSFKIYNEQSDVKNLTDANEVPANQTCGWAAMQHFGVKGHFTIDANDIKKGNKIRLDTITSTISGNQDNAPSMMWQGHNDIKINNIGHVRISNYNDQHGMDDRINHEIDFDLIVDTDQAYATDVSFDIQLATGLIYDRDTPDSVYASWFKGNHNPDIATKLSDKEHSYNVTYTRPKDNSININGVNAPLDRSYVWSDLWTRGDVGYNVTMLPYKQDPQNAWNQGTPMRTLQDLENHRSELQDTGFHRVMQLSGSNLADNGSEFIPKPQIPHILVADAKGNLVGTTQDDGGGKIANKVVLKDGLSAQEVYDQTPINSVGISKQSNGTYFIAWNLPNDFFKYTDDQVRDSVKQSLHYLMADDQDHQAILDNSVEAAHAINNESLFEMIAVYQPTKPDDTVFTMNDVTSGSTFVIRGTQTMQGYDNGSTTVGGKRMRQKFFEFIDDDARGIQVGNSYILKGATGDTKALTMAVPNNYELAQGQVLPNGNYTLADNNDTVFVHLKHVTSTKTQQYDVKRTINYVFEDGTKANDSVVNTLHYTVNVIHDHVTGKDSATDAANQDFDDVITPSLAGYTPDITKVSNKDIPYNNKNITVMVTYRANPQTSSVIYLDSDNDNKQISTTALNGKTGQRIGITYNIPANYQLSTGQNLPNSYTFDATSNQPVTVYLSHKKSTVNANDVTKNSNKYNQLYETRHRTIHFVYSDNSKAHDDIVQTVHFTRNADQDAVNGSLSNFTTWTTDGDYAQIDVPAIKGFIPNMPEVPEVNTNSDHDLSVTVRYNPNQQNIVITYIDDTTGKTLKTVTKTGITNGDSGYNTRSDINAYIGQGYKLTSDETANVTPKNGNIKFDTDDFVDDQNYAVHLVHDTRNNAISKTVTRTVKYQYRNGKLASDNHIDTITFSGNQTIDKVTGEVLSTKWIPESHDFNAISTPNIDGYTPDKYSIDSMTVTPTSDNSTIMVIYNPDTQYAEFNYIDDTTGQTLHSDRTRGNSDSNINYSATNLINNYKNKGYQLVSDGTAGKVLIYDHDDDTDQTFEIHFKHASQAIDPAHPGQPGKPINPSDPTGPIYKPSSNQLTKNVTRVINYTFADGRKAGDSKSDKLTFTDTQLIDRVTGNVISDTWSAPQDFADVTTPVIKGYTPNFTTVSDKSIAYSHEPIVVNVVYTADPQKLQVIYRDKTTGATLSQFNKNGVSDQQLDYTTTNTINQYVARGYKLVSDDTHGNKLSFDTDDGKDQVYYVDLVHDSHIYNRENPSAKDKVKSSDYLQNNTATINFVDSQGHTLKSAIIENDTYTRQLTIDSVTGNIINHDDWTLENSYKQVNNPVITGYLAPNISTKPTDKQGNQTINVVYTKLGQIHIVDNKGKEIITPITYTNSTTDSTKTSVMVIPMVNGYEQTKTSIDPSANPTKDTTVVFNAPAQITINYVDTVTGKTVKSETTKGFAIHNATYSTKSAVDDLVKQGYILTKDNYPTTVQFTEDPQTYTVTFVHGISHITSDKPVKAGTIIIGTDKVMPSGVDQQDLNKYISRTINIADPHTGNKRNIQRIDLTRDALVDNVTGKITYGNWSTDKWTEIAVPVVAGYTASQDKVAGQNVTSDTKDVTISITYKANPQTGKISYVDNGREIASTTLNGVTDQDIAITPVIPKGYIVANDQHIPASVKATATGIPTVVINLAHQNVPVDPTKPVKPSDKLPDGSNYPDGVNESNLTRDIARTITFVDPITNKTTTRVQTAHLTRTASVDAVTKAVTYDNWSTGSWNVVNVPAIKGYTPMVKAITQTPVTITTKNSNVVVLYTANNQTGKISYVDPSGKTVGTTTLTGKTNQNVLVSPIAPNGYIIVAGQNIPNTVKATADGIATIPVEVTSENIVVSPTKPVKPTDTMPNGKTYPSGLTENDLNKEFTRIISVTLPNGRNNVTKQVARYTRTATVNAVSGKVTYSDWKLVQGWDEFDVPEITNYTPSVKKVAAINKPDHDDQIEITYKSSGNLDDNSAIMPNYPVSPVNPADSTNSQSNGQSTGSSNNQNSSASVSTKTDKNYTANSNNKGKKGSKNKAKRNSKNNSERNSKNNSANRTRGANGTSSRNGVNNTRNGRRGNITNSANNFANSVQRGKSSQNSVTNSGSINSSYSANSLTHGENTAQSANSVNLHDANVVIGANNVVSSADNGSTNSTNNESQLPQTGNTQDEAVALAGLLFASMGATTVIGVSRKKKYNK